MTINQFCQFMAISRATFEKWKQNGDAPAIDTSGKQPKITRQAVEDWLYDRQLSEDASTAHKAYEEQEALVFPQ